MKLAQIATSKRLLAIMAAVIVVMLIVLAVMFLGRPVPSAIRSQFTGTLLIPQHRQVKIDKESYKYESQLKLVTFTATAFGKKVIFSEQPAPDTFTDIPQAFDKVVEQMQPYNQFNTDVGTVHLAKPKDLGGKQTAVLNAKGTLVFAKPETDLSDDEWRKLMGSLTVVK